MLSNLYLFVPHGLQIGQFVNASIVNISILLLAALAILGLLRQAAANNRRLVCIAALVSVALLPLITAVAMQFPWQAAPVSTFSGFASAFTIASASSVSSRGLATALVAVWIIGIFICLSRMLVGWMIIERTCRKACKISSPEWTALASAIASDLGLPLKAVSLRMGGVTLPVVCRVAHPVLLLPDNFASSFTNEEKRAVLLHELTHVKHRDCFWNYARQLICSLLWFHPLVWMISSRLRFEQELTCDDVAITHEVSSARYADILLATARTISSGHQFSASMAGNATAVELRRRFENILRSGAQRRTSKSAVRGIVAGFVGLVLSLGMLTAAQDNTVYPIGGEVSAPHIISKIEPQYTDSAKAANLEGVVILQVVIGSDGIARDIQVTKSLDGGLDANAIEAVKQWRFSPALRNKQPVSVRAVIEVNFRLI